MRSDLIIALVSIGCVLVILNAVFLGIIFFTRRKMATISGWPSTMGTIQKSYIDWRSSSDSGTTAYPMIQYSYQVGGQAYQSSKYAPGPEIGGTGAHKVVARYPAGAQVMVFYNPQNPADSVLERKAPALWLFWLLLVIFDCTLCGIAPVLWFTMK